MKFLLSCLITLCLIPTAVSAQPIAAAEIGVAGFVGMATQGPLGQPTTVHSYAEFSGTFGVFSAGLALPHLAPSAAAYFASGGQTLVVVRVDAADTATLIAGIEALGAVAEVTAVAVPGVSSAAVQAAMLSHCDDVGNRMALLDSDLPATVGGVLAQSNQLNNPLGSGALYFPWVLAAPDGVSRWIPPSAFAAARFAAYEPPQSPVGILQTATSVSHLLTTPELDQLNVAGVNAIRLFGDGSVRIWGARTISPDPEWRYVAVRRTALHLQESIWGGSQWALNEPNSVPLWAELRSRAEDFLQMRFSQGWFQGATPTQAYFVRCDASTMTQADLDAGRTVLLVGFAPLLPAEFVVLTIVLERENATGAPEIATPFVRQPWAAPNPFNPSTALHFELRQPTVVECGVFDAAGRRLRELVRRETLAAGHHRLTWDGRDASGVSAASGVYWIRLSGVGFELATPVTLVK